MIKKVQIVIYKYFCKIITAIAIVSLIPVQTLYAGTDRTLMPCEYLFQLSRPIMTYYNQLKKIILIEGKLRERNPIFTMFLCPAFKPEEVILIFETDTDQFVVERRVADKQIWASFQSKVWERYSKKNSLSWRVVPSDVEFTYSVQFDVTQKTISKKVASAIGSLLRIALEQRSVPSKTALQKQTYLDGTSIFFWLPDEICGFALRNMQHSAGTAVLESGYLLLEYVKGGVSEDAILNIALSVIGKSD